VWNSSKDNNGFFDVEFVIFIKNLSDDAGEVPYFYKSPLISQKSCFCGNWHPAVEQRVAEVSQGPSLHLSG
jgi:hypothetical protein